MKPTTILVSALATLAAAAPAPAEKAVAERSIGGFDSALFSKFGSQNFNYLANINAFDFGLLQQLALQQNFDALAFQALFQQDAILDVTNLLALGQLQTILQLAQVGVFNGFDLGGLALGNFGFGVGGFNLGVLQNGIGNFGLASLIQSNQLSTIQSVTSSIILA